VRVTDDFRLRRRRLGHPDRKGQRAVVLAPNDVTRFVMYVEKPADQEALATKCMKSVGDNHLR
jgi:hypothetical protein